MSDVGDLPVLEAPDRVREPDVQPGKGKPSKEPKKARRRWGGRLFGILALLLLAAGLAYGAWRYYEQYNDVMSTAQQARTFVPTVRVSAVGASPEVVPVSLPATTLAFTAANINARVSGYIKTRKVDIGDHVKQGQLLVDIYAPEIEHQLASAEAQLVQIQAALKQAEANRDLAQITWDRDRPLVAQGWVTKQQGSIDVQNLRAQEAAVNVAQANVNAQQAQVNVLRQQRTYQSVTAPFDGVITQRNVDVGDLVVSDGTNGTFMFTMMQKAVIRTQVYVPQDQAVGVTPGVQAIMTVPEFPGRTFPGKVTRIASALQPGTRTLLTEVDIPNPDEALTPGLYCTVELRVPRKTPSRLVPAPALIFNRDGMHVAVVEDGVAHLRKVQITRDFGTQVEVSEGVNQGDEVIMNPPVNLTDGSKVRVRQQSAQPR